MEEINDGGPARDKHGRFTRSPKTVRDEFALHAMKVILANSYGDGPLAHWGLREIASECYGIADAMIAERSK